MSPLQIIAIALCGITAAAVGVRAELLRKRLHSPFATGPVVRLALDLTAIAFVYRAIEVAHGGLVTPGGFAILAASAFASTTVLAGMVGRRWREALTSQAVEARLQTHAQDAHAVREAVQETVAPIAEAMKDWALSTPPVYTDAGGSRGRALTPHGSNKAVKPRGA